MDIKVQSGSYKSIDESIEWSDIPQLAILTGENGAGKTQLLEAIASTLQPPLRHAPSPLDTLKMTIDGFECAPHTVVYIRRLSDPSTMAPVGLADIQEFSKALLSKASDFHSMDPALYYYYQSNLQDVLKLSGREERLQLLNERMGAGLFYGEIDQVQVGLSRHYVNYWLDLLDCLNAG